MASIRVDVNLEKRVEQLEKIIKELTGSSKYFGSNQTTIGKSTSDLTLKTRGKIKIQWGNKFIDLIKDGKLNVQSKFIYNVNSEEDISGQDGLYVTSDGSVYLKIGDQTLPLTNGEGISYVSFLTEQNATSEQKTTALKNIGFLYDNLNDVDENVVSNGIIYIAGEGKLYTVINRTLSELSLKLPNPITSQIVIAKTDDTQGALVIVGEGINNSISLPSMYLYTEGDSIIDSSENIQFIVNDNRVVTVSSSLFTVLTTLISDSIQSSPSADSETGFRLYIDDNGDSILEVDKIIERDKQNESLNITPQYWWYDVNILNTVTYPEQDVGDEDNLYLLDLALPSTYLEGDGLYTYVYYSELENEDENTSKLLIVPFIVQNTSVIDDVQNGVYASINLDLLYELNNIAQQDVEIETIINSISNQILFKISSNEVIVLPRNSSKGFDILEVESIKDEQDLQKITTRVGDLRELELKRINQQQEELIEEKSGVYSNTGIFNQAQYSSIYNLPILDNSSRFASTEWVNKLIPKGTIVMFSGLISTIPENWAICDGTNGTPNLVNKFIKACSTESAIGDNTTDLDSENKLTIKEENLPAHSHPHDPHTHTVISSGSTSSSGSLSMSSTDTFAYNFGTATVVTDVGGVEGITTSTTSVYDSVTWRSVNTSGGSHSHSVSISSTALEATSKESTRLWDNTPIKVEPHAYSLIFIMKIV